MASFVHNNWKGHFRISVSKLCFKNALGLLINNSSNFQEEQIIIRKMAATFQEEQIIARKFVVNPSRKANYHSKNHTDENNRCHKNAGKFRQNIVSSKISVKATNFVEIRLHYFCTILYMYFICFGFVLKWSLSGMS